MAGNVFGNPVTDDIVRLIYPGVNEITPKLRAKVAFQYINADGRDVNCKNFVHNLKQRYGSGISSLCMIFNATGRSLTYVGNKDWNGQIYESPYPSLLQNGQWGAFCIPARSIPRIGHNSVSRAYLAVVRLNVAHVMENNVGQFTRTGIAYTEIRKAHHYEADHWAYIKASSAIEDSAVEDSAIEDSDAEGKEDEE
ncbi:hypothetical protein FNV43_RR08480 [Rhamnella rubrinervis]|uniref:Uncharacterized protein n=1 Tax=Rhamnella rubrinervis TaxID=2594499 RepID=A0A8K0H8N5_9ROSA|nr:hypothetical protein FNV43_RR08480 [Rhamnella rubrinervis]